MLYMHDSEVGESQPQQFQSIKFLVFSIFQSFKYPSSPFTCLCNIYFLAHKNPNYGFILQFKLIINCAIIQYKRVSWETISRSYQLLLERPGTLARVLTNFWHLCRGGGATTARDQSGDDEEEEPDGEGEDDGQAWRERLTFVGLVLWIILI